MPKRSASPRSSGVDPDVAALYRLPPEEFTAARDALAKRRKQSGDDAGSAAVKALRKPTVAAWALNTLARSRADDVRTLIEVSGKVRDAQRRALSTGKGDALRTAGSERLAVVRRLTSATMTLLTTMGRPASASVEEAVAQTLNAVATDEEVGRLLVAGLLSTTAEAAGFGDMTALSIAAPSRGGTHTAKADAAAARKRELEELAVAARAAETEAHRLERVAAELSASAEELAGVAAEATRHAEESAHAAARARADADLATKAAAAARKNERLARGGRE
jgi:hypothetical protein